MRAISVEESFLHSLPCRSHPLKQTRQTVPFSEHIAHFSTEHFSQVLFDGFPYQPELKINKESCFVSEFYNFQIKRCLFIMIHVMFKLISLQYMSILCKGI